MNAYASSRFFERIDKVLRRAVGVAENAPTDTTVEPAPEPENEEPAEDKMTKKLASELDHDVVADELPFDGEGLPQGLKLGHDGMPEIVLGDNGVPGTAEDDGSDAKVPHDEL